MTSPEPSGGQSPDGATSDGARHPRLAYLAPSIPYVAVLIGLYVLSSGWISILLYHLGVIAILSVTGNWQVIRHRGIGMQTSLLVPLLLASALIGPLVYATWSIVRLNDIILADELADLGLSGAAWLLFIVYYFTVNPLLEEVYWRGYLGTAHPGLAWTDVLFAGYHILVLVRFAGLPWTIVSTIGLAGVAWIWRRITSSSGDLVPAILSHAVADASLIWAAFFLAS